MARLEATCVGVAPTCRWEVSSSPKEISPDQLFAQPIVQVVNAIRARYPDAVNVRLALWERDREKGPRLMIILKNWQVDRITWTDDRTFSAKWLSDSPIFLPRPYLTVIDQFGHRSSVTNRTAEERSVWSLEECSESDAQVSSVWRYPWRVSRRSPRAPITPPSPPAIRSPGRARTSTRLVRVPTPSCVRRVEPPPRHGGGRHASRSPNDSGLRAGTPQRSGVGSINHRGCNRASRLWIHCVNSGTFQSHGGRI